MSNDLNEHVSHDTIEPPSARSTGYVFACVALIVTVLFRDTAWIAWPGLIVAGAFAAAAKLRPVLLEPLNRAWFRFALMLNKIMSPVIMMVLFAGVIVPYGLAMQLVRDPLRRRARGQGLATYWIKRKSADTDLRHQF